MWSLFDVKRITTYNTQWRVKRCVQSVCMACTRSWRCDARVVAKELPSISRTDCALTANTNRKRLTDVCAFRFQGKHNRKDSSNDPVITRILSSTLAEYTRVDERWDKNWTETQSLLTDLSIQLLRQCQIATVINVKKVVTCSIQRKNNWIIFAVSCRDNGNNSSCKGQKLIIMVRTLLQARKKNAFLIRKLAQQPLSSAARS